jgi:hypothetical protein
MRITITIDADNDAFTDEYEGTPHVGPEVARILRKLARHAEDGEMNDGDRLIDCNGNTCGRVRIGGAK